MVRDAKLSDQFENTNLPIRLCSMK